MIVNRVDMPTIFRRYKAHSLVNNSCCQGADMECKNLVQHVGYLRGFALTTFKKVEIPDKETAT